MTATVQNTGVGVAAAVFPVEDNGTTHYVYSFQDTAGKAADKLLEPGASKTLVGTLRLNELGKHTLRLGDCTQEIQVSFRKATFAYSNLRTKLGDGAKSDINSNKLHIKVDITNIGNEAGTERAALKIDGQVVESAPYTVGAGETKTVEFTHTFDRYGAYQATIGDAPEQTVYIEGTIQGMPLVPDKSGLGNDGYLHGAPELGQNEAGDTTVILDGKKDYIEIPDNENFTTNDGITGMVWAKLPNDRPGAGLGQNFDHNPLISKGVSIGWGTNYLYRMAVRSTGKITYGIGFDDDNGEFFWNDNDGDDQAGIKKGEWVQYTGAFDRTDGGDSYQNTYASGHIDAPAFASPIKNWPGASTYVGFSYFYTLLPNRSRGMYSTWLPGEISQVRLYTSKISAEENAALYEAPDIAGASAEDLVIWLDFNDIKTEGAHTTEWVVLDGNLSKLHYAAEIAGASSITATVQLSDDQQTVKSETAYSLADGEADIDLSAAGTARYARIRTTFVSDLNTAESTLPVLLGYDLTAGTMTSWSTLTDWNRGVFEEAAAHQSADLYRNVTKDFDDYSGTADSPDRPSGNTGSSGSITSYSISASAGDNGTISPSGNISVSAGGTKTFTIRANTGYEIEKVLVDGKSVGAVDTYTFEKVQANHTIAVKFRTLGEKKLSFTDVKDGDWHREAVCYVYSNGLMNGVSDTLFAPDQLTSRAMLAQIFYNRAGRPAVSAKNPFADVPADAWYTEAVLWANAEGMITGYGNGMFGSEDPITREQLAVILWRHAGSPAAGGTQKVFADASSISSYASDAVKWASENNILSGKGNDMLDPCGNATRAEVATMLMRYLEMSKR